MFEIFISKQVLVLNEKSVSGHEEHYARKGGCHRNMKLESLIALRLLISALGQMGPNTNGLLQKQRSKYLRK